MSANQNLQIKNIIDKNIRFDAIHENALACSRNYKKSEADLLEAITQVRDHKVYRHFECASLFEYCVKILKLDPGVVYAFTAVAKKVVEVPELKFEIARGALNVSTAKRITSVITKENAAIWIGKAATLSQGKLEKEIATANPKLEVQERASYLNSKRVRLELGLDEKLMLKLRRIQDLESQKRRTSVDLEETLAAMAEAYLAKNDPLERAKRAKIRGGARDEIRVARPIKEIESTHTAENPSLRKEFIGPKREAIPSSIKHQVYLRDKGECQFEKDKNSNHQRGQSNHSKCRNRRFIEIHHQKPVSQGGTNSLENLTTLCSEHHKIAHLESTFYKSP